MKYYAIGIALLAAFGVLAYLVTSDSGLAKADYSLFTKINSPHGKTLDKIMVDATKYGREGVWIATMLALFVIGGRDGRRTAVLLVIAFIILVPLGTGLKDLIDRPRPVPASPEDLLAKADNDASFPSGHAVIVSAGAFIMLARFNRGRQVAASLVLAAEALIVIYSRIYVGNHYPLDVVGGALVGTGIGALVVGVSRHFSPIFTRLDSLRK